MNENVKEYVPLWEGTPPGHEEGFDIPHIKYFPPKGETSGAAVITFAGGGYRTGIHGKQVETLSNCQGRCSHGGI